MADAFYAYIILFFYMQRAHVNLMHVCHTSCTKQHSQLQHAIRVYIFFMHKNMPIESKKAFKYIFLNKIDMPGYYFLDELYIHHLSACQLGGLY